MKTSMVVIGVTVGKSPELLRECLDSLLCQLITPNVTMAIVVIDGEDAANKPIFDTFAGNQWRDVNISLHYIASSFPMSALIAKAHELRAAFIVQVNEQQTFDVDWIITFFEKAMMIVPDNDQRPVNLQWS